MWLKGCQRLIKDSSGRFAPFMFGLLLAVSAFSMTMKSRVEVELSKEKLEQQRREQLAADDLKQALETDMLLESTYSGSINLTRARKYLENSDGKTVSGNNPILDIQTGTSLDSLTRQTTLIGVTDDAIMNAAIIADTDATNFMAGHGNTNTAVFDDQAVRQMQLALSKKNLDAYSSQVLQFISRNSILPTTDDLATITSNTGLKPFWSSMNFSNVVATNSVTTSFTPPWGGTAYSNIVSLPLISLMQPYLWTSPSAASITFTSSSTYNSMAASPGILAITTTNSSTGDINIYEYQSGAFIVRQKIAANVIPATGAGSMDIVDNIMVVHPRLNSSTNWGNIIVYRRQSGFWQEVQRITHPDAATSTLQRHVTMTRVGNKLHLYVGGNVSGVHQRVLYYIANDANSPNFVFQSVVQSNCSEVGDMDSDFAYYPGWQESHNAKPLLLLGCPSQNSNRGGIRWYRGDAGLVAVGPMGDVGDRIGESVSVKLPYAIIGAPMDEITTADKGVVYIYQSDQITYSGGNYSGYPKNLMQRITTTLSGDAACGTNPRFGNAVAFIDDLTFAAQLACSTSANYRFHTYTLENGQWIKKMDGAGAGGGVAGFGSIIATAGNMLAYSARTMTGSTFAWIRIGPAN